MEEINIANSEKMEEAGIIFSDNREPNDPATLILYKQGKKYFVEHYDNSYGSTWFMVEKNEENNIKEAMKEFLYACADAEDDSKAFLLAWGLEKFESIEVDEDFEGAVEVIEERDYQGHTPLISHGIFETYKEAKKVRDSLDAENGGDVYFLQHNENSKPCFYCVEAY